VNEKSRSARQVLPLLGRKKSHPQHLTIAPNGVLFVAAVGNYGYDNDTHPAYPPSYDCNNIIAVMATDHNDERSIWPEAERSSAYGAVSVDLAAPGSDILGCVPGNGYEFHGGTSMAAPHVAGACALVWSRNPGLGHLQVKDVILENVDKLASLEGLCVSDGRLNLYNALLEAASITLDVNDNLAGGACLAPEDYLTYTITCANPITDAQDPAYLGDVGDVNIVAYLPDEIESSEVVASDGGVYDVFEGTVTWNIGTLQPGEEKSVTVTIRLTEEAEPLGTITTRVILQGENCRKRATETTSVCCFGGDVIYVDDDAAGCNTGMSWANAYTDLTEALDRAARGCGNEIWVAGGLYKAPVQEYGFVLADGISLLGGFEGTETDPAKRDLMMNQTVVTGDADADGYADAQYVLAAVGIDAVVIDGLTVEMGYNAGIYAEDSSVGIKNSTLSRNERSGVYLNNSVCNIANCVVKGNYGAGVYCDSGASVEVKKCIVCENLLEGIYCWSSALDVNSSLLYRNYWGIYLKDSYAPLVVLRNNTIADNDEYGVYVDSSAAAISNSVIWGSNWGALYISGGSCTVSYCCVEGGWSGAGNISSDPGFYDADANNYHLAGDSPCIDAGDPSYSAGANESDIDGEQRVMDGDNDGTAVVDMGADEYYHSPSDLNGDEKVEFFDYAIFASAWAKSEGDAGYNELCDLAGDNNIIDHNDLRVFCADWLWQAPWHMPLGLGIGGEGFGQMSGGVGGGELASNGAATALSGEAEQIDVAEMVKWLESLWLEPQIRDAFDEEQWQQFIEQVKAATQ